jgi:hypothetical protein
MAPVDEQLALERRRAPLAAIGAAVAALLPLAGGVAVAATIRDQPKNTPGRLIYIHDHAGEFVLFSLLLGLGAIALTSALYYLYTTTKARRPELPRVALFCALFGPVVYGVVQIGLQLVLTSKAATFADPANGNQTYEEAKHVFESGVVRGFQFLGLGASLALGFAFVMLSLNAMRVGLLTKFMGILGIIVGVLFVVPLAPGPPVVQSFWLAALAALFGGRWPRGVPPAWTTGKAIPWPSQQEVREQREAGLAAHRGAASPQPEPEPATATAAPAPGRRGAASSKKRKRKKRH